MSRAAQSLPSKHLTAKAPVKSCAGDSSRPGWRHKGDLPYPGKSQLPLWCMTSFTPLSPLFYTQDLMQALEGA